jgi:CRISPR/Cas system Type II protein with McrA/HNH and RuvC-like nuclease domain
MPENFNPLRTHMRVLWDRQRGVCFWCGNPMSQSVKDADGKDADDKATIDHVIPQSAGGSDDLSNLVLACHSCNNIRSRYNGKFAGPLKDALQHIEALKRKIAQMKFNNEKQSISWRTMNAQRNEALAALDAIRNAPPPLCSCWWCRLQRRFAHPTERRTL